MASFAEEIAPADVKARAEATLLECGYKRSFSFGLWWAFEVKREYAPQPRRRRRLSLPSEAVRWLKFWVRPLTRLKPPDLG